MNIIKLIEGIKKVALGGDAVALIESLTDYTLISNDELEELVENTDFLSMLESCGVDNWEGYSEAQEMFIEQQN